MRRSVRFVAAAAAASLVGVFGFAGAALAHVTVNPNAATQGGYARIAFRVPDESDTLSTTRLEVSLPTDQPIASVLVMPVPGWSATVTTAKLANPITTDDGDQVTEAVSQITWVPDAPASAVKPGQFQEFPVSLGPLPKVDQVVFKALQTYSDGSVVRWIDVPGAGQAEPEHPAPVLKLTADSAEAAAANKTSQPTVVAQTSRGGSGTALTIAIIGLVLGLVGAVLGGLSFVRGRRRPAA
jgi:uncharacterized protein YcnI